jgi:hypothetical protein
MAIVGIHRPLPGSGVPATVSATSGGVSIGDMQLSLLLIVIGIVLAVLVNYGLGIACILIGLVLLIWPRLRTSV